MVANAAEVDQRGTYIDRTVLFALLAPTKSRRFSFVQAENSEHPSDPLRNRFDQVNIHLRPLGIDIHVRPGNKVSENIQSHGCIEGVAKCCSEACPTLIKPVSSGEFTGTVVNVN